jgi:hypothetical protein
MNWTRALHDITTHDGHFDRAALGAAIAHDTVYLPSELAARLLPLDDFRSSDLATWARSAPAADLRAPAH